MGPGGRQLVLFVLCLDDLPHWSRLLPDRPELPLTGLPVPDMQTLRQQVLALEAERHARMARIDWQFTNRQARGKLKRLYLVILA
jgi:hypothetical protein